jgi:hypothetical protein
MIIRQSWGIPALLIPAVLAGGGNAILQEMMGSKFNLSVWIALLLLASAAVVRVAGHKLNSAPVKNLIDPETGEVVGIKAVHSMFWIPLQWYAVVCIVAAVVVFYTW